MNEIGAELRAIIDRHLSALQHISQAEFEFRAREGKWNKKEILGHLVDSAQNNIRRFVMIQYEEVPKIVYNQDKWVSLQDYQHYDLHDLINLWYLLNKHICHLLEFMPPEMADRKGETKEPHTLRWLGDDYLKHLRHHLHQVLDLEPVPYP